MKKRPAVAFAVILMAGAATPLTAFAESFDWIMQSISQQGALSNGDGHQWSFRSRDGGWQVVGKDGITAEVSAGDPGLVEISGFPQNWGANGDYVFAREDGSCQLRAKYSRHRLKWGC